MACVSRSSTSTATASHADISPETARITTLGGLKDGSLVNLERSMRADARIGGHFVQGHVDATGHTSRCCVRKAAPTGLTVSIPSALQPLIVPKGSIAVDGISLTVAAIDGCRVDVQIIPFTWQHTNLHAAATGDSVNIECDILGKYVVRALRVHTESSG